MVAPQGVDWRREIAVAQAVEDAGGRRSPIHIVPQENRHDLGRRGNKVGADLRGQGVKKVETAVDVADRVDARSRGERRGTGVPLSRQPRETIKSHRIRPFHPLRLERLQPDSTIGAIWGRVALQRPGIFFAA